MLNAYRSIPFANSATINVNQSLAQGTYFTLVHNYLKTSDAVANYQPGGSYLTTTNAASTYLTIANASTTYQPVGNYLTTTSTITADKITNLSSTVQGYN